MGCLTDLPLSAIACSIFQCNHCKEIHPCIRSLPQAQSLIPTDDFIFRIGILRPVVREDNACSFDASLV